MTKASRWTSMLSRWLWMSGLVRLSSWKVLASSPLPRGPQGLREQRNLKRSVHTDKAGGRYLNSKKKKDFSSSAPLPKCTPGLSHLYRHTRCPGPEPIILQQRLEGSVLASQASPAMGTQSWEGGQREGRNSRKVDIYLPKKKIKWPKYDDHSPFLNEKRLVCLFVCNFLFPQILYQVERS